MRSNLQFMRVSDAKRKSKNYVKSLCIIVGSVSVPANRPLTREKAGSLCCFLRIRDRSIARTSKVRKNLEQMVECVDTGSFSCTRLKKAQSFPSGDAS